MRNSDVTKGHSKLKVHQPLSTGDV